VMFCAGPTGCPPSNCLDATTYDVFQSYGKRKRRDVGNNRVALEVPENSTREELTAFIRVLAEGEELEAAAQKYQRPFADAHGVHGNAVQRSDNIVQVEQSLPEDMLCIAEASFISIIVTVSLLCVLFSAVIVAWGCAKLRGGDSRNNKLAGMTVDDYAAHSLSGLSSSAARPPKTVPVLGAGI